MKRTSNSRGITLISLVVTIIILIILAGVSINLVLGEDGILKMAQNAKKSTEDSAWLENAQIIVLQAKLEKEQIEKLTEEELASANRKRNNNSKFKTRKDDRIFNKGI